MRYKFVAVTAGVAGSCGGTDGSCGGGGSVRLLVVAVEGPACDGGFRFLPINSQGKFFLQ